MTTSNSSNNREGKHAIKNKSKPENAASEEHGRTYGITCINLSMSEYDSESDTK